mmetsp:Transcript_54796/g.65950  ORF Transcript_54796/g.65950 Transcript_54796/m.65950 type:complete len:863 (+) Transcript_54796:380-2968(+)
MFELDPSTDKRDITFILNQHKNSSHCSRNDIHRRKIITTKSNTKQLGEVLAAEEKHKSSGSHINNEFSTLGRSATMVSEDDECSSSGRSNSSSDYNSCKMGELKSAFIPALLQGKDKNCSSRSSKDDRDHDFNHFEIMEHATDDHQPFSLIEERKSCHSIASIDLDKNYNDNDSDETSRDNVPSRMSASDGASIVQPPLPPPNTSTHNMNVDSNNNDNNNNSPNHTFTINNPYPNIPEERLIELDAWNACQTFEEAILLMNPRSAAFLVRFMAICNLGAVVFQVQTMTWWAEQAAVYAASQRRTSLGIEDMKEWEELEEEILGGRNNTLQKCAQTLMKLLINGPAAFGPEWDNDTETTTANNGIRGMLHISPQVFVRTVWLWMLLNLLFTAIKTFLRFWTLVLCHRRSLYRFRRNASHSNVAVMQQQSGAAAAAAAGVAAAIGAVAPPSPSPALHNTVLSQTQRSTNLSRIRSRIDLQKVVRSNAFRIHARLGRFCQVLVLIGFVLYMMQGIMVDSQTYSEESGEITRVRPVVFPVHDVHVAPHGRKHITATATQAVINTNGDVETDSASSLASGDAENEGFVTNNKNNNNENFLGLIDRMNSTNRGIPVQSPSSSDATSESTHNNYLVNECFETYQQQSTTESTITEKPKYQNPQEITVAVLLDICCTNLVIVLFRSILAMCVMRFYARHVHRLAHSIREVEMNSAVRGLSPDEMNELTQERWEGMDSLCGGSNDAANTGSFCSVCLDDYDLGDTIIILPCGGRHKFHEECIKSWLRKRSTCPLCQDNVRVQIAANATADVSPFCGRTTLPASSATTVLRHEATLSSHEEDEVARHSEVNTNQLSTAATSSDYLERMVICI